MRVASALSTIVRVSIATVLAGLVVWIGYEVVNFFLIYVPIDQLVAPIAEAAQNASESGAKGVGWIAHGDELIMWTALIVSWLGFWVWTGTWSIFHSSRQRN